MIAEQKCACISRIHRLLFVVVVDCFVEFCGCLFLLEEATLAWVESMADQLGFNSALLFHPPIPAQSFLTTIYMLSFLTQFGLRVAPVVGS